MSSHPHRTRPRLGGLHRALSLQSNPYGWTLIEILIAAGLAILIVGGGVCWLISTTSKTTAVVTNAQINRWERRIEYGSSGKIFVEGDFSEATTTTQTLTVKLWESDDLGTWNRDSLKTFTITVGKGVTTYSGSTTLACDAQGVLELDDDDSDRQYEVYAEVIPEIGTNREVSNEADILCAPVSDE